MNAPVHGVELNSLKKGIASENGVSAKRDWLAHGAAEPLIVLDRFNRMLAEAEAIDEVTDIRSRAEAVRSWVKSAALGLELQNRAAEVKLRAERKAGQLLADLRLRGGDRKSAHGEERVRLSDLGISHNQSKRWQKEAAIPEDEFQCYVRSASQLGEEVTTAGLLRLSHRIDSASASRARSDGIRDNHGPEASRAPDSDHRGGEAEPDGEELSSFHREYPELVEMIDEMKNHHALLITLLEPLYEGRQETLLPGQRRGIRHYMFEVERLLLQLLPREAEEEGEPKQSRKAEKIADGR